MTDVASSSAWIVKDLEKNPPPDPLPTGWIMRYSRSQPGTVYYYNQESGQCLWQRPTEIKKPAPSLSSSAKIKTETASLTNSNSSSSTSSASGGVKKEPFKRKPPALKSAAAAAPAAVKKEVSTAPPPNKKLRKEPKEVRVLHILKKHKGSRRPASWRNPKITCTIDEAKEELEGLVEVLKEASSPEELRATFEELARTESDCSSAKRGGDLGFFGRKKMQPPFENASFALEIGELSGIVETSSGVHVILRIG